MKEPSITVYMPVYNTANYLVESINSILCQSFKDFEFIIIDDGSTDNSLEIIRSFSDSRIQILKNDTNLGVRKASNICIRNAKGKYIVRMDSDDISVPDRLQKQWSFMEMHPEIGISGGQMSLFGYENGMWKNYLEHDEIKASLLWGVGIFQPTFIYRAAIFQQNYFYEEDGPILGEDWEFLYKIKNNVRFANVSEILIYYRRQHQNATYKFRHLSKHLNAEMHRKILADYAIFASDDELILHGNIDCEKIYSEARNLQDYYLWMNNLSQNNTVISHYSATALKKIIQKRWYLLFYYLPDLGYKQVFNYWKISKKIHRTHFIYYSKWIFNKLVGRKQKKV
ncbi:MAG: glycosyltransferase family A protein [Bacteroidia bacterium]